MQRFFNTAGPCNPDDHYMLPATSRLPDLLPLIDQKSYFVIHAPRQTGKTTAMLALARQLTDAGRYAAILVSMEVGAAFNQDPGAAEKAILGTWRDWAEYFLPADLRPPPWPQAEPGEREYAIGMGRMDLCLRYSEVTLAMELKVWRDGEKDPLAEGLEQLDGYLAGLGLDTGWLVIFDQRAGLPPIAERTDTEEAVSQAGRRITVIRR